MKIIISPAKSLNFQKALPIKDFSIPLFLNDSCVINESLRLHSPKELKNLMGISEKLADLNWKRNINFKTPFNSENARPAIFTFAGDVYNGLDAFSLSLDKVIKAQDSLRILSGLYGLLRPLDLMQPYRLEMGTTLKINRCKNLYAYWGSKIADELKNSLADQKYPFLIHLASDEYFKSVELKNFLFPMIRPVFKEQRGDQLKSIHVYAKRARGLMANFIIKNRISNPAELKKFNVDNYRFNKKMSNEHEWFFIR